MKDYSTYTTLDFVLDKDFQEWVQHPDENNNAYWKEVVLLHPGKQATIDKAIKILRSLKFNPIPAAEIPEEKLLEGILDKVNQDREKTLVQTRSVASNPKSRVVYFHNWSKIAASFALLTGLSFALYYFFYNHTGQRIQTAYGETREVMLPDGSSVILNANSRLKFSADWNDVSEREVWLNGEAYFRVAKVAVNTSSDKNQSPIHQKFVVHTQDLDVVVLGTSFNVNQRQEKTQVVLAEGKVEVMIGSEQKRVMMAPGELLEYAPLQGSIAKAIVNPETYSSWQTHQLIFDGVPLAQVAQRLEEIFGYEVVCRKEISNHIFKGTVPSDDIEVSLAVIQNAFGIKVTKSKGQIIFSK